MFPEERPYQHLGDEDLRLKLLLTQTWLESDQVLREYGQGDPIERAKKKKMIKELRREMRRRR